MKSFSTYTRLSEEPLIMSEIPREVGPDLQKSSKSVLTKNINKLFFLDDQRCVRKLRPKKLSELGSGQYSVYHASHTERPIFSRPTTHHHILLTDNETRTVVGMVRGEKIKADDDNPKSHHIGIRVAAILPEHRGKGAYADMLHSFVTNTPHVMYSDTIQSPGAAKAWQEIAKRTGEDDNNLELRVHPLSSRLKHIQGREAHTSGVEHTGGGELSPRFWEGGKVKWKDGEEEDIGPMDIVFSLRGDTTRDKKRSKD
jgi:hypothetical protein